MRRIQGVVVITTFALAAAGCGGYGGGSKKSAGEGGTTTVAGMQTQSHGMKDVSGASKAEVEMYDNYFEPTALKGKPGQKITIELKNSGKVAHTFTISNQSVDKEIQPGASGEAQVTFPQSGQVEFRCKFHGSAGMIGALEVSSSSSTTTGSTSTSRY